MSGDHSSLPYDVETLLTLVQNQAAAMEKLQQEIEQLKFASQKLLKDRYGPQSEKLATGQLTLFELGEEQAPAEPPVPDESPEPHPQRRRGGGRRKLPDSLPREVLEHDLSEADKCCPECGVMRQRIGNQRTTGVRAGHAKSHRARALQVRLPAV